MVPQLAGKNLQPTSFPRASGDGPSTIERFNFTRAFPPRERGWSLSPNARLHWKKVSPARAGMVPCASRRSIRCSSFPRASGDGPAGRAVCGPGQRFPPRERGWSRFLCGFPDVFLVSPARAGMVPKLIQRRRHGCGFPRASGDGPNLLHAAFKRRLFPPRERGWSLVPDTIASIEFVSPARAGMVPTAICPPTGRSGFPRASGDGPWQHCRDIAFVGFPPRERGWSPGCPSCPGHWAVSPARAGMVPVVASVIQPVERFPRASGDGRAKEETNNLDQAFPPRERGWSSAVVGE